MHCHNTKNNKKNYSHQKVSTVVKKICKHELRMKLLELGYVSQGTGFHKKCIQFSVLNGPSPSNVTWSNIVLQSMCHMINKIKHFPLGFFNKFFDVFRQLNVACLLYIDIFVCMRQPRWKGGKLWATRSRYTIIRQNYYKNHERTPF